MLLPIMAAIFGVYIVMGMAIPVLPLYVHGGLGFGPFVVGLVSGSQFAAGMFSRLWAGRQADTKGATRALLTGVLVAAGSGLVYLFSFDFASQPIWQAHSSPVALLGVVLTGMGYSLVYPRFGVEAIRRAPVQSRGLAMASYTAFLDLSLGVTGLALGLVAGWAGLNAVFFASTAVILCAAAVAFRLIFTPVQVLAVAGAGSLQSTPHTADLDAMEAFEIERLGETTRREVQMKAIVVVIAIPVLVFTLAAQSGPAKQEKGSKIMQASDVMNVEGTGSVAPALQTYARGPVAELWNSPGLSRRDRSMITLSALIARNQTIGMAQHMNLALDSGLKPREISEIITHLAFYSGWSNAMSAVSVAKGVFAARHIGADQVAAASPTLMPLNKEAEEKRATGVEQQYGKVVPGVVQYTTDVLFRDLWLRPDLAPRDRSLVTVTALVANGQAAQVTYHLNRAMDNGLTQTEAAEAITHLAFYVGWPNVFSALPIAKDVFEKRGH